MIFREDDSDTTNNIDLASVLNLTMTSPDTEPSEKTEHPTQTEQVTRFDIIITFIFSHSMMPRSVPLFGD